MNGLATNPERIRTVLADGAWHSRTEISRATYPGTKAGGISRVLLDLGAAERVVTRPWGRPRREYRLPGEED